MLNKNIFRAYDIRGIYNKDFDLKGAEIIGKGYGTLLLKKSKNKKNLKIVAGRDGRTHSEEIQKAFIRGVLSTGIEVTNVGLSPSPLLYFSICFGKFDGGVNITASHNPKEYNGFKLQRKDAESIFGDEIQELYDICIKGEFVEGKEITEEKYGTFFPQYMDKIKSMSKTKGLNRRNKIVIDAGNGVAGPFASLLFKYLGYEVIELYCDIDGNFPNHPADPEQEKTLEDLMKRTKSERADLGIAFDGDGDRVGIVDNEGNIYNADKLLILLARDLIARKPKSTVVYELNITSLLREEVEKLGGKAVMCKTGHSYVEHEMKENKALLAGENSGHLFFADNYYGFDDASLAAVLICKILLKDNNIAIKDHFKNLPKTFEYVQKWEVKEENKFEIIEKVAKTLSKKYKVNRLDGVRIEFDNFGWLVFRASNTSPKVQLRIETRSEIELGEVKKEIIGVIEKEVKN